MILDCGWEISFRTDACLIEGDIRNIYESFFPDNIDGIIGGFSPIFPFAESHA